MWKKILGTVIEREGITSRELMDRFDLGPCALRSHIRGLLARGYVTTVGPRFHYYPTRKAIEMFGKGR